PEMAQSTGACAASSGSRVDSKLLAECYIWPKVRTCRSHQLGVDCDGSSHESNCRRRVSDNTEPSNLCPQLCPVVGTSPTMETRPAGTCCPDGPSDVGATGFEPATS